MTKILIQALISMGYRKLGKFYAKPVGYHLLSYNPETRELRNQFHGTTEVVGWNHLAVPQIGTPDLEEYGIPGEDETTFRKYVRVIAAFEAEGRLDMQNVPKPFEFATRQDRESFWSEEI